MENKNYQKVSYFATIPAPVRYSKDVSNFAKLLYAEITCLTNAKGYCFAMNGYLADLYKVHKNTISGAIKELENAGFVRCNYITKNKEIVERRIYLVIDTEKQNGYEIEINGIEVKSRAETYGEPINNSINTPNKKEGGVSQKTVRPLNQKSVENVSSNVTVNVNSFKNKEMNKTNELVLQNQSLINNQFDGILDLSVRYNCKDIEIETQLNEILKSEKMNAVKKLYNEIARNNLFKGKTYDNILNWHKNNLKINCLTSIWLYDYEVIKLRMKYNADYLLKIIYEIDRYLQDPTKFSKYTDQYKFIENWIKRDIGHILTIKTHIRVDMYDYVNYGVDYDLFK